jgi:RimJ/RimL family protein N-acetyltransferase
VVTEAPKQSREASQSPKTLITTAVRTPNPTSQRHHSNSRIVQLKTKRLLLREFTPDDYDDAHAYGSDPDKSYFFKTPSLTLSPSISYS